MGVDSPLVTKYRSRRYVGIRASHRSLLPGSVVLDVRSSGATYVVEPKEAIELNNLGVRLANSEKPREIFTLRLRTSGEHVVALTKERDQPMKQRAQMWRSGLATARERGVMLEAALVRAEVRARISEANAVAKQKDAAEKEAISLRAKQELLSYLDALLQRQQNSGKQDFKEKSHSRSEEEGDSSPTLGWPAEKIVWRREMEWLSVPRVPCGRLQENTRKHLQHKRECVNQILKAAMVLNSNSLAEMEIPDSYLENLPKNGRSSVGGVIYRYITSEQFSSECLHDCLDFSYEHQTMEVGNRAEASVYLWRLKATNRPVSNQ